jgi:hypothetical protein
MDKGNRSTSGKKLLIFIAKFFVVSLPLFGLWIGWGYFYVYPVLSVAKSSVQIFGLSGSNPPVSFDICSSPIPFISLMVITKHLKFRKRLSKVVIGLLILLVWHLVACIAFYLTMTDDSKLMLPQPVWFTAFITFIYIFNMTLPFLLWFFFVGKNRIKTAIL